MAAVSQQKRTSRLSVAISAVLHGAILLALFFFAAREGMLGKQLKKITVTMVPKEQPPEKPKEKPEDPKPPVEPPPDETPKPQVPNELPSTKVPGIADPSPALTAVPTVAPPPSEVSSFDFGGGKPVESSSDPNILYKSFVEHSLRSRWIRPDGVADESFVAEVELAIGPDGQVLRTNWKKGSGHDAWDNSVKRVVAQTKSIGRKPPKGFPAEVLVRFDVQAVSEISLE
jgi:periplasmic protein TonB